MRTSLLALALLAGCHATHVHAERVVVVAQQADVAPGVQAVWAETASVVSSTVHVPTLELPPGARIYFGGGR